MYVGGFRGWHFNVHGMRTACGTCGERKRFAGGFSGGNPGGNGRRGGAPQYKMAFSGSELANPWVAMVKDGFEAACKDNGSNSYPSMRAAT